MQGEEREVRVGFARKEEHGRRGESLGKGSDRSQCRELEVMGLGFRDGPGEAALLCGLANHLPFPLDQVTFSFEAGRRCISGEGNFEFETRQGNEIFLALEEAISAQKNSVPPGPQTQPATAPAVLPQLESPYSQPHDSLPPPSPTGRVARSQLRGPEGEYAVPFDVVGRSLGKSLKGILVVPPKPPTDPLYDSIQERPPSRPDHIYDEPEGVAVLSLYDSPQEPLRDAWRRHATDDGNPSDPQHIYPAGQDFPASSWPQGTEYDNVILKKGPK